MHNSEELPPFHTVFALLLVEFFFASLYHVNFGFDEEIEGPMLRLNTWV